MARAQPRRSATRRLALAIASLALAAVLHAGEEQPPTRLLWPDSEARAINSLVEPNVETNLVRFNGRAYLFLCALFGPGLPMTTVAQGTMSSIDEPLQVVVRTEREWKSLWRRHGSGQVVPAVDFAKKMIVAVFLGSRPTAGYKVDIVEIVSEGHALIVRYTEGKPAPDRMVAQIVTAPFHVVSCDRREGAVRFVPNEP